jgi:chromosome segregation ATPase
MLLVCPQLVAERDAAVLALKTCEFTKRTLEASVMKLEQEAAQLLKTISEQQSSLEGLQSELRRAEKSQELARMSREDSDAKLATALSEVRAPCKSVFRLIVSCA